MQSYFLSFKKPFKRIIVNILYKFYDSEVTYSQTNSAAIFNVKSNSDAIRVYINYSSFVKFMVHVFKTEKYQS